MEMLDSIIATLSYFFVQVVAVLVALKIHQDREDRKRMDRLEQLRDYAQEVVDEIGDRRVRIKAEIDDGIIFVYDSETGEYMAHANSYEDIEEELSKKFPGKLFDIPGDQLLKMKMMKKQIRSQED
jgi:signal transduction histidine kinase